MKPVVFGTSSVSKGPWVVSFGASIGPNFVNLVESRILRGFIGPRFVRGTPTPWNKWRTVSFGAIGPSFVSSMRFSDPSSVRLT